MNYVWCAVCDDTVPLDTDHSHVAVKHKRMDDRDGHEDYFLCQDCAIQELADWSKPP
jgi:uncharacterized protein YlaI